MYEKTVLFAVILSEVVMEIVKVVLREDSFSSLLAGLYTTYHNADVYAIPSYVWLMITEALIPYMDNWCYDIQSFEDWISNYLIITAKEVCTQEELAEFKKNTIYIEAVNGNMVLVATGDILWEHSTNI